MGYTASGGPKGLGVITDSNTPLPDLTQIIALIARVGNVRVETTSSRDAITGPALYDGLMVFNTTTDRLEVRLDGGWQVVWEPSTPVTNVSVFGGGFSAYNASGWSGLKFWRRNGIVYVNGAIQKDEFGSAAVGTAAANIPAGFRPPVQWQAGGSAQISPAGDIVTQVEVPANGAISISATYPV